MPFGQAGGLHAACTLCAARRLYAFCACLCARVRVCVPVCVRFCCCVRACVGAYGLCNSLAAQHVSTAVLTFATPAAHTVALHHVHTQGAGPWPACSFDETHMPMLLDAVCGTGHARLALSARNGCCVCVCRQSFADCAALHAFHASRGTCYHAHAILGLLKGTHTHTAVYMQCCCTQGPCVSRRRQLPTRQQPTG